MKKVLKIVRQVDEGKIQIFITDTDMLATKFSHTIQGRGKMRIVEQDGDTCRMCAYWKICHRSISGFGHQSSPGLKPRADNTLRDVSHIHIGPSTHE